MPASLYTAQPMGHQFDPSPLYWIMQAREGRIELELEDDRRWYLHVAGQEVDVDAGMLRDLVRVLQRPEVRTALLLME